MSTLMAEALDLVGLGSLGAHTRGDPAIAVGLVDGPVATDHPAFAGSRLHGIGPPSGCTRPGNAACGHGTFIAGLLCAQAPPGICPDCTLLVRPVFLEAPAGADGPTAPAGELARAILDCVTAGARIINVSAAASRPSVRDEAELEAALQRAARHGVLVVAASGNQAAIGSSTLIRNPWVIPVGACDQRGAPLSDTNLSRSAGARGVLAPGGPLRGLTPQGHTTLPGGTSAAAAFVSGVIALVLALVPGVAPGDVRWAVTTPTRARRRSVVPPLLDARATYERCRGRMEGR